jgi:hypothetical protein
MIGSTVSMFIPSARECREGMDDGREGREPRRKRLSGAYGMRFAGDLAKRIPPVMLG